MTRKRWIAALSALGIVIAATLTTAAVMSRSDARSADDSPLVVPSTTSTSRTTPRTATTRTTTTTVDLSKLSRPQPAPSNPYAPTPTVTLIACHPKHSAAQRIVVKGSLIADIPRP